MSRFLNSKYQSLSPYVPGEQTKDKKYIKLNTNESPFPPSPKTRAVLSDTLVQGLRLYEDPNNTAVKEKLASHYHDYQLNAGNFCVTSGSDEAIELAFMAFSGDGIQFPDISYGFYAVYSDLHQIDTRISPLMDDFSIDIRAYQNNDRAIVIANPNAPTGLFLEERDIRELLIHNPDHIVIVDEAYIDFGGKSAISLIPEFPNLLVIQTFSKSRSLAGARIGFAAGNEALIEDLERLRNSRNPYNMNALSQNLAIAAIEDTAYYEANCREIMKNRDWTIQELRKLGFQVADSYTNFIFARHPEISGKEVFQKLRDAGILVRHFDKPRISDYNRISIGIREDMEMVVKTMKEIVSVLDL